MYGNYLEGFHYDVKKALSWNEFVFKFTAAAAGTEHVIVSQMASDRVFLITGDGSVDLSAARAEELAKDNKGQLDTARTNLKTALQTYFTDIPAVADGAKAIAFALSLGQVRDCAGVSLNWSKVGAANGNLCGGIENVSVPTYITDVALSASDELLLDDGSTALSSAKTLVVMPEYGLVFGYIAVPDALFTAAALTFSAGTSDATASLADTIVNVPEASDILTFRALVK